MCIHNQICSSLPSLWKVKANLTAQLGGTSIPRPCSCVAKNALENQILDNIVLYELLCSKARCFIHFLAGDCIESVLFRTNKTRLHVTITPVYIGLVTSHFLLLFLQLIWCTNLSTIVFFIKILRS